MELRLRVVEGAKQLTLPEAIKSGKIKLNECGLHSDSTRMLRSTSLLDSDENELFEGDTVADEQGRLYSIIYKNGAFFAVNDDGDKPRTIPLYLLQGDGHIPIKISKRG